MAGIPTNVAQLMAVLSLNTAPFEAGMARATGAMSVTGPLALAAVATGAIIAGTGIIATKMAGDFQKGITSLVTGAGESQANIKMVSDGILQMAQDTGTSTAQLIDGMYMIESGGFHGANGLAVLQAAAEGAKVGNADLGVVADATDTILKNYGEHGALTATQATNALITTVANGKVHLENLAESLSAVLPAASAAGIGLNDVMAAMATMTNVGIPAAESATYIRQLIVSLSAPAAGARGEMDKLGISMDVLSKKMHTNLGDALQYIVDKLHAAGIKEGSQQWVAAIRDIAGGQRQMQGLLVLTQHLDTVKADIGKIGDVTSSTSSQVQGWALVQQNMNQQFDRMKEVAEALFIQLGQNLLPIVTKLFQFMADKGLPALKNLVTGFGNANDKASALKPVLTAVAGVIGGTLVAALTIYTASALAAAVASFEISIPMLALLAVGAAVGALVALLVTHWSEWTKKGGALYGVIQALHPILQKLGDLFGILGKIWTTEILPALAQLLPILKVIGIIIGVVIVVAIGLVVGLFIAWAVAMTGVVLIIVKLVEAIVFAVTHFGDLLGVIGNFFGSVFGKIGEFFGNVFGQIGKSVGDFFSMVGTLFQAGLRAIVNTVTAPFHAIVNLFHWLFDHNYYFHDLVIAIQNAFNNAKTFVMNLWTNVTNWLRAQWERIKADVMLAWVLVQAYIVRPVEQAYNAIVAKLTQAALWMLGKWNEIKGDAQAAWKHFTDLIGNAVTTARDKINEVLAAIMKPVNDLGQKLFNAGKNMIQMLINGIKSMAGNVGHAAGDIAGQITKFLGFHSPTEEGPGATADQWMPNLIKMLTSGLAQSAPQLRASSEMTAHVIATPFIAPRPGSIAASPAGSGGINSGQFVIQIQPAPLIVDGRKLADINFNHTGQVVRARTGTRSN